MLEVVRALARVADQSDAAATEARSVAAIALFDLVAAGSEFRKWEISAGRVEAARAAVLELSWNQGPDGELVIELVTRPGPEAEEAPG